MSNHVARHGGLILGALGAVMGLVQGCSSDAPPGSDQAPALQGEDAKLTAALAAATLAKPEGPCGGVDCDPSIAASVEPSLVVLRASGHEDLLDKHFNLQDVLQQLLNQSGVSGETPKELLHRLWDTYNDPSTAHFTESFAPHCGSTLNGFPLDCPRTADGELGDPKGSVTPANFIPVALFNRFDLAPVDGANCGEYRIVYWTDGTPNKGTLIFEAQMPNPHPECGIEACRPVAEFWNSLSGLGEGELGAKLHDFYYKGLSDFSPAIELKNYGLDATSSGYGASGGQVRVNTIGDGPWQLREMHLALGEDDKAPGQRLFFQPVTDKNNPFGELFDVASSHPTAPGFQSEFTAIVGGNQVVQLAAGDVNLISMSINDKYNSGQSTSQNSFTPPDDYLQSLPGGAVNAFTTAIDAVVPAGTGLTADDIVERATTQSCAGCHQISNGRALGGGISWPFSGTPSFGSFVHVGPAGDISQALHCVFLPHRQSVLSGFLQGCGTNPPEIIPADCGKDVGAKSTSIPAQPGTASKATIGGGSGVN